MKTIFKVLFVSTPQNIIKKDGTAAVKQSVTLRELGGKYEDKFVATWIGEDAINLHLETTIAASLRFQVNSYEGKDYQDVLLTEYVSLSIPIGLPKVPVI